MLSFKIEKDGEQWHTFCPELPGCHSFGKTKEEAINNLKNAVQLYLEDEIEQQCLFDSIESDKNLAHA